MPTELTNGVVTHYQRAGQGPDVILIHGLATNLAFWYFSTFPALSRDFTVAAYDLRGHGRSEMATSGYNSATMAGDLEGLMDRLEIQQAHLVAHSFGAAIALELAVRRPERVGLVLADPTLPALRPTLGGDTRRHWAAWAKELEQVGAKMPDDPLVSGLDLFQDLALLPAKKPVADDAAGTFMPFRSGKSGRETAELWGSLMTSTAARSELPTINGLTLDAISSVCHPTLMMIGGCSMWLTIREQLRTMLPDSRETIVPGAGHFHPFTRPRFFANAVREFLLEIHQVAGGGGR